MHESQDRILAIPGWAATAVNWVCQLESKHLPAYIRLGTGNKPGRKLWRLSYWAAVPIGECESFDRVWVAVWWWANLGEADEPLSILWAASWGWLNSVKLKYP